MTRSRRIPDIPGLADHPDIHRRFLAEVVRLGDCGSCQLGGVVRKYAAEVAQRQRRGFRLPTSKTSPR